MKVKAGNLIKRYLKASTRLYEQTFHKFDIEMFSKSLRNLGVKTGDTLFVHSSYDAFRGFTGKPTEVLAAMESLVGPAGTILMPSLPFTGTAIDYVRSGAVTDLARTPSRTGLLAELFRRQPGTLRSIHPTHPVLARGGNATAMIEGHENANSPCGEGSPFAKLLQAEGRILFVGASIESMSFFHYLEEKFEKAFKVSPLTQETFSAKVKAGNKEVTVQTRLYNSSLSRRRVISSLLPELRRGPGFKTTKAGLLSLTLVDAAAVRDAFQKSLQKGINFYQ